MNSHPPQAKKRRGEDKDVNNLMKSFKLGEYEDPVNFLNDEKVKKSILSGCDELLDLIRKSFLQKKRDFLNLELAYEESEDRLQQCEEQCEEAREKLALNSEIERELNIMKHTVADRDQELDNLNRKFDETLRELTEVKEKSNRREDELKQRIQRIAAENEELISQNRRNSDELAAVKEKLNRSKDEVKEKENELSLVRWKFDDTLRELTEVKEKLNRTEDEALEKEKELSRVHCTLLEVSKVQRIAPENEEHISQDSRNSDELAAVKEKLKEKEKELSEKEVELSQVNLKLDSWKRGVRLELTKKDEKIEGLKENEKMMKEMKMEAVKKIEFMQVNLMKSKENQKKLSCLLKGFKCKVEKFDSLTQENQRLESEANRMEEDLKKRDTEKIKMCEDFKKQFGLLDEKLRQVMKAVNMKQGPVSGVPGPDMLKWMPNLSVVKVSHSSSNGITEKKVGSVTTYKIRKDPLPLTLEES